MDIEKSIKVHEVHDFPGRRLKKYIYRLDRGSFMHFRYLMSLDIEKARKICTFDVLSQSHKKRVSTNVR